MILSLLLTECCCGHVFNTLLWRRDVPFYRWCITCACSISGVYLSHCLCIITLSNPCNHRESRRKRDQTLDVSVEGVRSKSFPILCQSGKLIQLPGLAPSRLAHVKILPSELSPVPRYLSWEQALKFSFQTGGKEMRNACGKMCSCWSSTWKVQCPDRADERAFLAWCNSKQRFYHRLTLFIHQCLDQDAPYVCGFWEVNHIETCATVH